MTTDNTAPISLDAQRAARRDALNAVLTPEQARKRAVSRMRSHLLELIEDKYEDAKDWLDMVATVDGPKEALELYIKLLEYAVPKLSRAEVTVEENGKTRRADFTIEELQQMILEARTIEGVATHVTARPTTDTG